MLHYLKVFWYYVRTSFVREAEFRSGFFVLLVSQFLELGVMLAFFTMLYGSVTSIKGWGYGETLLLLGTYSLIASIAGALFYRNFARVSEYVNQGRLDLLLTKPIDAQFSMTLRFTAISDIIGLIPSVLIINAAVTRLGLAFSLSDLLGYVSLVFLGVAIVYALWFAISLLAFWLTQVSELQEMWFSLYEFARYPPQIYEGGVRFLLSVAVPILTVVAVPAEFFLGRLGPGAILQNIVIAAGLLALTRVFWNIGLRRYSSASS